MTTQNLELTTEVQHRCDKQIKRDLEIRCREGSIKNMFFTSYNSRYEGLTKKLPSLDEYDEWG